MFVLLEIYVKLYFPLKIITHKAKYPSFLYIVNLITFER